MNPEELAERLTRLEEQMRQTQTMFADHIQSEEEQFALISMHVKELRDILIGAKGALKVLGWLVVGLASFGTAYTWITHNMTVGFR